MNLICAVFLSVFTTASIRAEWLDPLFEQRGLNLGDDLKLHLEKSDKNGNDFFERHSLRVNYGGYGITVGKAPGQEALKLGIFISELEEARKNDNSMTMSMILGYKLATVAILGFSAIGALVFKAVGLAKLSIIISGIILATKLFRSDYHYHEKSHHLLDYLEVDALPEDSASYAYSAPASTGLDYQQSEPFDYYTNGNFNPSPFMKGQRSNYIGASVGKSSIGNTSVSAVGENHQQVVQTSTNSTTKRHDSIRFKAKIPTVTIQRIIIKS